MISVSQNSRRRLQRHFAGLCDHGSSGQARGWRPWGRFGAPRVL